MGDRNICCWQVLLKFVKLLLLWLNQAAATGILHEYLLICAQNWLGV
jgi:hypothetical protein